MNKREFGECIRERVADSLGERYEVKLHSVRKNNAVTLLGIMVTAKGQNISPTLYVDNLYQEWEKGMDTETIVDMVLKALNDGMPKEDLKLDSFLDFEKAKERICFRLISAERNAELLKEIPFLPYLDLAVCFFYAIEEEGIGKGSILIRNEHLKAWNANVSALWKAAGQNTRKLFPEECFRMDKLLMGIFSLSDFPVGKEDSGEDGFLWVLTNREKNYGASVILYEGCLDKMASALDSNLLVVPSSLHEVLILPQTEESDADNLQSIVEEMNSTVVERQDVLSDHVYLFDKESKKLRIYGEGGGKNAYEYNCIKDL